MTALSLLFNDKYKKTPERATIPNPIFGLKKIQPMNTAMNTIIDSFWSLFKGPLLETSTLSFLTAESILVFSGVKENHNIVAAKGISSKSIGYAYFIQSKYEIFASPNSDKYPIIIAFLPPPEGVPIDPKAHP